MIHVTQGVEEDIGKVDTFAIGCAGMAYGNPFNETATWGSGRWHKKMNVGLGCQILYFL